jgi:galactokinase
MNFTNAREPEYSMLQNNNDRSIVERLKKDFYTAYGHGEQPVEIFFAAGRVNLLGEHTDYNGGWVMPFAIPFGTFLIIRKTNEKLWKFRSINQPMIAQITSDKLPEPVGKTWVNYPLGVFHELRLYETHPDGLELLFYGDIPGGAGLSSSASIEMVTAVALNEIYSLGLSVPEIIQITQRSENNFVGVNCGIMDMFAIGMGQSSKVIALNCETLEFTAIPLLLKEYGFVIANTMKERSLAASGYNKRREECVRAVEMINRVRPLKNLGQLSLKDWETLKPTIENKTIRKRAGHVVTENQRVMEGMEILRQGDMLAFGQKMIESHTSLRDDYEVSCRELDIMVEASINSEGCVGSRMTGAGFGGCTISLVRNEAVDNFMETVGKQYLHTTGLKPDFYVVEPADGIRMNRTFMNINA